MKFKLKNSKEIYKGRIIDLKVDEIEYENGVTGYREVAMHPGGAVVLALHNGKIILVTQYRYPLNKVIYELPAGKLDNNEDPLDCARRELEEETGYKADNFIRLGEIVSTPGFCDEKLTLYLARDLKPGNKNHEEGEVGMETHEFSLNELEEKIHNNEIIDAKTICALYLAKKYLTE
ncbi:MAG: NUDIX hydrolase [Ignavibacteriaceae bacterium]|jgi:ADP-ribose pyrophosphatase|nr:NUDIX hydrolase [Ignavibacteriaceae bacterium]